MTTGYTEERAQLDVSRCLSCKKPGCVAGCPVSVPINVFITAIKEDDYAKAVAAIKSTNLLPARKEEVEHAQHEGVQFKKMIVLLAQTTPDMQFPKRGDIAVESEATGRTTKKGVFAGGDIVTGAATVILAAGAGRAAGMAIDKFLKDGEWWYPNAPKPAEAAPAAK